jgi:hypothetical protein
MSILGACSSNPARLDRGGPCGRHPPADAGSRLPLVGGAGGVDRGTRAAAGGSAPSSSHAKGGTDPLATLEYSQQEEPNRRNEGDQESDHDGQIEGDACPERATGPAVEVIPASPTLHLRDDERPHKSSPPGEDDFADVGAPTMRTGNPLPPWPPSTLGCSCLPVPRWRSIPEWLSHSRSIL